VNSLPASVDARLTSDDMAVLTTPDGRLDRLVVLEAADVVGEVDIADRLNVPVNTVRAWSKRRTLPVPDWRVSGRPAWEWIAVREWAGDRGRLPGLWDPGAPLQQLAVSFGQMIGYRLSGGPWPPPPGTLLPPFGG